MHVFGVRNILLKWAYVHPIGPVSQQVGTPKKESFIYAPTSAHMFTLKLDKPPKLSHFGHVTALPDHPAFMVPGFQEGKVSSIDKLDRRILFDIIYRYENPDC
jgi:hypothetical protein